MKIQLTIEESEEFFYNALCNAVGTGYMEGYGLKLTADRSQYKDCRDHLARINPDAEICYEDVLMQILRDGGTLTMEDVEGEGAYTSTITLADVHTRIEKTPVHCLINMHEGNDDAMDSDAILQTVFFEEIVFG